MLNKPIIVGIITILPKRLYIVKIEGVGII